MPTVSVIVSVPVALRHIPRLQRQQFLGDVSRATIGREWESSALGRKIHRKACLPFQTVQASRVDQ